MSHCQDALGCCEDERGTWGMFISPALGGGWHSKKGIVGLRTCAEPTAKGFLQRVGGEGRLICPLEELQKRVQGL